MTKRRKKKTISLPTIHICCDSGSLSATGFGDEGVALAIIGSWASIEVDLVRQQARRLARWLLRTIGEDSQKMKRRKEKTIVAPALHICCEGGSLHTRSFDGEEVTLSLANPWVSLEVDIAPSQTRRLAKWLLRTVGDEK